VHAHSGANRGHHVLVVLGDGGGARISRHLAADALELVMRHLAQFEENSG